MQGDTGPTGPTGASGLEAYAGKYSEGASPIVLTASTPQTVTLASDMAGANVNTGTANSLTIQQAGDYEINYGLWDATSSDEGTITLEVQKNGAELPGTSIVSAVDTGGVINDYSSTIATLADSDVITLVITSSTGTTVTPGTGTTAILSVKKISQ